MCEVYDPSGSADGSPWREPWRDYLLSVDGQEITVASEARSLLRGPAGVTAVVEVERGGQSLHLRISRETYRPR